MSRIPLLLSTAALAAVLSACGGGGQQSQLTPSLAAPGAPATADAPIRSDAPQSVTAGIPKHITTWAYDEYWAEGANASTSQVRQYLSYAQSGLGNSKASTDCTGSGVCKSVFYFDPHFFYDTVKCGLSGDANSIATSSTESWFVHEKGYTDYTHRVHGSYTQACNGSTVTSPVYALNTSSSYVRSFYANYLHTNASAFDEFFLDDTSGEVLTQFYGPGGGFCPELPNKWCTATQELATNTAVINEHIALANSLTHTNGTAMTGVYNGLNFTSGQPNDLGILKGSTHFVGAVCEGCIVSGGALRPTMYASVLNAMAQINAIANASIVLMSNGNSASGSAAQIAQRTVTTAMAWLGYSQGHTIVFPNLETGSHNLAVFPENSIYPTGPLQSLSTGATNLQVATGVYRREFTTCYNAGTAIGPCAAIVNSTGSTITVQAAWLHQTYGHTVALIGGDIASGGHTALGSYTFRAGYTTVAPSQALMIVR